MHPKRSHSLSRIGMPSGTSRGSRSLILSRSRCASTTSSPRCPSCWASARPSDYEVWAPLPLFHELISQGVHYLFGSLSHRLALLAFKIKSLRVFLWCVDYLEIFKLLRSRDQNWHEPMTIFYFWCVHGTHLPSHLKNLLVFSSFLSTSLGLTYQASSSNTHLLKCQNSLFSLGWLHPY